MDRLSEEDKLLVQQAKKENRAIFITAIFVAEQFTGMAGEICKIGRDNKKLQRIDKW